MPKDEVIEKVKVAKGNIEEVDVIIENDISALLTKGDEKDLRIEKIYNKKIVAPLTYREKVGVVNCYLNDEMIKSEEIVVNQEVKRKNFGNYLNELLIFSYTLGRDGINQ